MLDQVISLKVDRELVEMVEAERRRLRLEAEGEPVSRSTAIRTMLRRAAREKLHVAPE